MSSNQSIPFQRFIELQSEDKKFDRSAIEERLVSVQGSTNAYQPYSAAWPASDKYKVDLEKDLNSFIGTKAEHTAYEEERKKFYKTLLLKEKDAYHTETSRLRELFRSDLEQCHSMVNHPKKDILWEKAWEHGHSGGFSQVKYWYEDFLEFLD